MSPVDRESSKLRPPKTNDRHILPRRRGASSRTQGAPQSGKNAFSDSGVLTQRCWESLAGQGRLLAAEFCLFKNSSGMLLGAEVVITSSVASGSLLEIDRKTAAMLTAITPRPFPLLKRSEESSFSSVSNEGSHLV